MASERAEVSYTGPVKDMATEVGWKLRRMFEETRKLREQAYEKVWLDSLRQYKGQYDPSFLSSLDENRSRVFLNKTRPKILTLDSQLMDKLWPAGESRNFDVKPSPEPEPHPAVIDEIQQVVMLAQAARMEQETAAGVPPDQVTQLSAEEIKSEIDKEIKERAKRMALVIEDQLTECDYKRVCGFAIHSGHLYGTGVVKGPLVKYRRRNRWVPGEDGWRNRAEEEAVPFVQFVRIWDFFPDMSATDIENAEFVFQRHVMLPHELLRLAERPGFRKDLILKYLSEMRNGDFSWSNHEQEIFMMAAEGEQTGSPPVGRRFEPIEGWAWLSGNDLRDCGGDVADDQLGMEFRCNVWMLGPLVIKAVINPFEGTDRWPYQLYYFDKDDSSIFGVGMAEYLRHPQEMYNASIRVALDNAAITAGAIFEVNEDLLSRKEKNPTKMFPWRVLLRKAIAPGDSGYPALRVHSLPNILQFALMLLDRAGLELDEISMTPRYMYGDAKVGGGAKTATGLSMLMGQLAIVYLAQLGVWDTYVTRPLIRAMVDYNMERSDRDDIKGDWEVIATGLSAVLDKELMKQSLREFAADTLNPMDAPLVDRWKLLVKRAESMNIRDVVKELDEILMEQRRQQEMAVLQAAAAADKENSAAETDRALSRDEGAGMREAA